VAAKPLEFVRYTAQMRAVLLFLLSQAGFYKILYNGIARASNRDRTDILFVVAASHKKIVVIARQLPKKYIINPISTSPWFFKF